MIRVNNAFGPIDKNMLLDMFDLVVELNKSIVMLNKSIVKLVKVYQRVDDGMPDIRTFPPLSQNAPDCDFGGK